jgi:hypothetical protein
METREEKAADRPAPQTREELAQELKELGLIVPDRAVCPGHNAPLDYAWYSYSGNFPALREPGRTNGDCVVWANRGGGKTILAAAVTYLEGLYKDNCKTRILAGSLEQSRRMYEYLLDWLEPHRDREEFTIRSERCVFPRGTQVRILPQSQRAIRGLHINKLRCDEVEMFDPQTFESAKYIAKSRGDLLGALEVLSTMHRPCGLMHRIISDATDTGVPVFRWCLWETIEKCTDRSCDRCPLDGYCGKKAQRANGYLTIDDAVTIMRRSSRQGFETEMLCLRPNLEGTVFADFDPAVHVRDDDFQRNGRTTYLGIDFGFNNPFVCLWIQVDTKEEFHVIDEYVRSRTVIAEHIKVLQQRLPIPPCNQIVCCDPSGSGPNGVTGTSEIEALKEAGFTVRSAGSKITDGLERIRRALRNGEGKSTLTISPKCKRLIEALQCYHYPQPTSGTQSERPLKDGVHDHSIDALRYFFMNYRKKYKAQSASICSED